MPHDPFQVPELNAAHRRILDAVGLKVPASANLDDARDALEDRFLTMKRGPERSRLEDAFRLMMNSDVMSGNLSALSLQRLEHYLKTAQTKKKSSEHGAGSDGNYMTKQNLWLAHRVSEMLYRGIPDGVLLPDWAESKINSATQHLKEVAGWAMHESHGDDLHPPPEANPIHLAAAKTYLAARDLKWKDGTVLKARTPVTVTYRGDLFAVLNHDGLQHTTKVRNLPVILKGYPKAPSLATLQKWSDELVSKTPTGARVELDGYGPDGSPSWLLVLGLI